MPNSAGLRLTEAQMRQTAQTAQFTFVGACTAILVFCAVTWATTLSLFL